MIVMRMISGRLQVVSAVLLLLAAVRIAREATADASTRPAPVSSVRALLR